MRKLSVPTMFLAQLMLKPQEGDTGFSAAHKEIWEFQLLTEKINEIYQIISQDGKK